jgi:hypothetical protein
MLTIDQWNDGNIGTRGDVVAVNELKLVRRGVEVALDLGITFALRNGRALYDFEKRRLTSGGRVSMSRASSCSSITRPSDKCLRPK